MKNYKRLKDYYDFENYRKEEVEVDPLSDTENSDIKTHIPQQGWIKQREEWRTIIKAIAESIRRGDAIVGGSARECENCSFKGLCRIEEFRQP